MTPETVLECVWRKLPMKKYGFNDFKLKAACWRAKRPSQSWPGETFPTSARYARSNGAGRFERSDQRGKYLKGSLAYGDVRRRGFPVLAEFLARPDYDANTVATLKIKWGARCALSSISLVALLDWPNAYGKYYGDSATQGARTLTATLMFRWRCFAHVAAAAPE